MEGTEATGAGLWITTGVLGVLLAAGVAVPLGTPAVVGLVCALLAPSVLALLVLLLTFPGRDHGTRDWSGLLLLGPHVTLASTAAASRLVLPAPLPETADLLATCFLGVATALLAVGLLSRPEERGRVGSFSPPAR